LASAEHSEHQIVEDPGEADLILFTDAGENQYSAPTNHACFRIFPQKCFDVFRATNRANSEGNLEALELLLRQFIGLCQRSKFVLCPRGVGVSSMRLFESMAMARSPVILSDEWVPLPTIPWEQFSIRVAESDWAKIPEILKNHEQNAEEFGLRAKSRIQF
jgi:Exostosin family